MNQSPHHQSKVNPLIGNHYEAAQSEVSTVYVYHYDFDEEDNCKSGLTDSEEHAKRYPTYSVASIDDLHSEMASSGFVYEFVRVKEGIAKFVERGDWDSDDEEYSCGYELVSGGDMIV